MLEAAVVVPIAQFRTQVVVAERVEGLTHAVDGTVDWAQVQPRRLSRHRLAAPAAAVYGDHSPGVTRGATSEWRNWQTRQLEGLVSSGTWGFKSPLRHAPDCTGDSTSSLPG